MPCIAFESAIITHGLPYPENIGLISEIQKITVSHGVYLALFWLDEGYVKVGLEEGDLEKLAASEKKLKVSSRDIPFVLANRYTGGTTVSATIFLAHRLGLDVFATGGLGGVHYGAESSFDISNDLIMLSRIPIITISAGIKSVLDIGKTLELLETLGISIFGYRTSTLPLFYTRESDISLNRIDSVSHICQLYRIHQETALSSALLIVNPVPERWSIDADKIDLVLEKAVIEAEKKGISGQELTPFLLHKLSQSGLNTVKTNLELVKNNVLLASEIAGKLLEEK